MVQFSVIIPLFNGEKYISTCLNSLHKMDYDQSNYEIIVVDNNSTDNGISLVDKNRVKILHEHKKGSYAARNKGIEAATGHILAFTDVDCIVSKDWLKNAEEHFKKYRDRIVSGSIEFIDGISLNIWGVYDKNRFLKQELNYQRNGAATANLFVKKETFQEVGLFDADLQSSGDVTWVNRAHQMGISFGYDSTIKVYHPVRNSFREITEKCFRVGYGRGQIARKNYKWAYLLKPTHISPGPNTIKQLFGKPVNIPFYVIKMFFVIYYLNWVEYKGKVKGYFSLKSGS